MRCAPPTLRIRAFTNNAASEPTTSAFTRLPWPATAPAPQDLQETVATLREKAFDAAVIFTVYSQSPLPAAMLCWLAGIPLRLAHCRENLYHLLSDWIADPEPHELLRH